MHVFALFCACFTYQKALSEKAGTKGTRDRGNKEAGTEGLRDWVRCGCEFECECAV
jgi:hypothetical protein